MQRSKYGAFLYLSYMHSSVIWYLVGTIALFTTVHFGGRIAVS